MKSNTEAHRAFMRPKFPEAFELFYAVFEGTVDEVVKRLEEGDNINATDFAGRTPIFYAVQFASRLDKADVLFDAGAVIDIWDYYGLHPLHFSLGKYRDACTTWLLDCHTDPNVAVRPARQKQLYEPIGWTALHKAAYWGLLSTVELLLANGANPNSQALDGSTPLHVAARRRNLYKRLIRTLIDAGAQVNAVTDEGRTPIHEVASCMGKHARAVSQYLLFRGAKVDIRDASGNLPVELLKETPLGETLKTVLRPK